MNCLGIDFGTTSVKAVLFDEKLREKASYSENYTVNTHGNIVELEVKKYDELLFNAINSVKKQDDIGCLAIDTQCETLILTDEHGNALCDAIVWLDNRATDEAAIIEKHFGRKKIYEITGQPEVTATWPACKLLWIKRNRPDIWEKTKKIFLLEDYLLYKLTGEFVTEKTLQSSTIYFDINCGEWWKEMLEFIGIDESFLPALKNSGEPVGEFEGIKVITSAMDQVAGAIGAGAFEKGIVSEMTGTTMAIYAPSDSIPPFDENSFVPCHYSFDGSFALLSWSPTAGMALKWFRDAFLKDLPFETLSEMAAKIPPGCDGLTFLPYLCGSTMPKYNPDARGSFTGITPEHTAAHFVRSIMEAVACMLKDNLDYLGVTVNEIRIMGGGAKSDLWNGIKADMTKKRLVTLKNKETACLGAAILAGVGASVFGSVREACMLIETDKVYEPSGTDYSDIYKAFGYYDSVLNTKRH